MLLFHALSAHSQPRGDPTSRTSSSSSQLSLQLEKSLVMAGEHLEEVTPKGLQPLQAWKVSLPHPAMVVERVRVWAQHCPTHQLEGSCSWGKCHNQPWPRHWGAHWAILHCLLNKEIKKKKKIKTEFICIKSKLFELCINRRFWLAFPKEALISFVKWGNGCATLHEGVYKRCKWGICCMQKAKRQTAANPHSQGELPWSLAGGRREPTCLLPREVKQALNIHKMAV